MNYTNFDELVAAYKDDEEVHRDIWIQFKNEVNATPFLKWHRDFIVKNRYGYGNRSLHYMWKMLVGQMPDGFNFLEIGVFKGQILNLVGVCATQAKKKCQCIGVTPLDSTDGHPKSNYENDILNIQRQFSHNGTWGIVQGLSTDTEVMYTTQTYGPYDLMYIDGGHTYEVVMSDLKTYPPMLKVGGFLVVDDASNYLKMPKGLIRMDWFGIPSVSNAVRDVIEPDDSFKHLFAVGHNRVWKRVK